MSDLVHRLQAALLGSAGPEDVRALLRELAIPANAEPHPDALKRVRRCILYAGCTEAELRDAFAGLGLSGGGGGDPRNALFDIRAAILRNM